MPYTVIAAANSKDNTIKFFFWSICATVHTLGLINKPRLKIRLSHFCVLFFKQPSTSSLNPTYDVSSLYFLTTFSSMGVASKTISFTCNLCLNVWFHTNFSQIVKNVALLKPPLLRSHCLLAWCCTRSWKYCFYVQLTSTKNNQAIVWSCWDL